MKSHLTTVRQSLSSAWIVFGLLGSGPVLAQSSASKSLFEQPTEHLTDVLKAPPSLEVAPAVPQTESEMAAALGFDPEDLGFFVWDLDTGAPVRGLNNTDRYMPASVTKVFSAAFALETIAPTETFPVTIYTDEAVPNGQSHGNIYLYANSHPHFPQDDLERITTAIRESGVTEITGRLIFDDNRFRRAPYVSDAFDIDHSYNPGVGAWSFQKNRLPVMIFSSAEQKERGEYDGFDQSFLAHPISYEISRAFSPEEPLTIRDPHTRPRVERWFLNHWAIQNSLIAAAAGSSRDLSPIRLDRVPVKDSGTYLASQLSQQLETHYGPLPDPKRRRINPDELTELTQIPGAPLWQAAKDILAVSDNAGAELLSMHAVRAQSPRRRPGMQAAARGLQRWVQRNHPPYKWSGFEVDRASGLSVDNWMTAEQIVQFLATYEARQYAGQSFREDIMPDLSGLVEVDGEDSPFLLSAKTGYLSYVRALSGYIRTETKNYAFAMFINDLEDRAVLNAGPSHPRYQEVSDNAGEWAGRSRELRRQLLVKWITEEEPQ